MSETLRKIVPSFIYSSLLVGLIVLFVYNDARNKFLDRKSLYLQLLTNQTSNKNNDQLIVHNINRLHPDPKCECRQDEAIELVKYSFQSNGHAYFVNLVLNDDKIVKSYTLKADELERANFSCGLYNSLRSGPNRKVVAYSPYEHGHSYLENLKELAKFIFPKYKGWIIQVYYDNKITDPSIICQLECLRGSDGQYLNNVELCNINQVSYGFLNV